jgi:hypothetical protein
VMNGLLHTTKEDFYVTQIYAHSTSS